MDPGEPDRMYIGGRTLWRTIDAAVNWSEASSVIPASGTLTVHVVYRDAVAGPTMVFTSLQNLAAYQGLARSFQVPASDPLYVADVTASNASALQNRSFIYDDALAIVVDSMAGNFAAAAKILKQLNYFLDHPGYLASQVLENAEDGSTARWSAMPPVAGTITNLNDPLEPPYGTGNVLKFHAATAGGGVWDRWTLNQGGTHVMTGDPAHAALPSIYAFGGTNFDASGALT